MTSSHKLAGLMLALFVAFAVVSVAAPAAFAIGEPNAYPSDGSSGGTGSGTSTGSGNENGAG